MRDFVDLLTADRPLAADEREALDRALAADPTLAATARRLETVRRHLRARLDARLPDHSVLVLHALADVPGALTLDEQARLTAADVPGAIAAFPGVAAAVSRVAADRDAFEAAWAEDVADDSPAPRPLAAARPAADRRAAHAPRVRPMRWVARVSALAAVVAFAAVLVHLQARDAGWATYAAATDRTVTLPDGSTAFLAAGSRLRVPGAGLDPRQARLEHGRALFRVVHDPAAPFTVETPNAEVTVLGTTFTVRTGQSGALAATDVVLVEGAVTLAPRARPDAAVRLTPGLQSRVQNLDAPRAPAPADVAAALAWTGDVTARGERAADVAARLGDRFGATVEVDARWADERVSGTFGADGGADGAAEALARLLGGTVERPTASDGRPAYRIVPAR